MRFWINRENSIVGTINRSLEDASSQYQLRPVKYPQLPNATMCGAREFYENLEEQTTALDDLFRFWDYLNEYVKLHKRILAGELPLRIVRLVCPSADLPCDGWGDRTKGIFNVIIVGMMTKRAFVIGNATQLTPDSTIDMFYGDPAVLDWNRVIKQKATLELKCFRVFEPRCFSDVLKNGSLEMHNVVDVTSNIDQAFRFATEFPEFLQESRIDRVPFWKSLVFKRFFPTTPNFEKLVSSAIPQIPLMGIHIRTGHNEVPDFRYVANVEAMVDNYINCVRTISFGETFTVFAAADTKKTLNLLQIKLKDLGITKIITADGLGEIGHNAFVNSSETGSSGLATRLMVDFEILRRVPVIVGARSGFSLMAHRIRYYQQSTAILGSDKTCTRVPTRHSGFCFSVWYW